MRATLCVLLLFVCTACVRGQGPLRGHLIAYPVPAVPLTRTHLPPVWQYHQLGAFCKLDVQLERRLPLPLVIRLGDVRMVDRWEGKITNLVP
jgi:hypothetical protein